MALNRILILCMRSSSQQKTLMIAGMCTVFVLVLPLLVQTQDLGIGLVTDAGTTAGFDGSTNETTFATTIGRAIRLVLSFVGIGFTVLIVYAGILWMTARGNESQVETAQKTMQNAIIGLLIAIGSYSISGFIIQAFETGASQSGKVTSGGSGECCMLCERGGLSGACNFSTLDNNPDLVIAGPIPVPSSGRCSDLEDNYPECGGEEGTRCVSRKHTNERCNE